MQRSMFDIGRADARAGGMSMTSGSGGDVWHVRVVLVVRGLSLGPLHRVFWRGLGFDVLREEIITGMECRGFRHSTTEIAVAVGVQATPTSRPHLVFVAELRDCASCPIGRRLALPCLVHDHAVEGAVEDGAGKSGARLRLDAALEAAEDGHVAMLQVRRASWRKECEHDVRESGPHGCQGGLAGVDARHVPEKDPRLSLLAWIEHVVESGRERQDRGRRCPAVLRSDVMNALRLRQLRQDGVCLASVHNLPKHVQRATVHAEGDRKCHGLLCVALQLGLFRAAAAPPDLMHRQEAARGLVDVHDAVCADCVRVHEPAQLDEQPVRVGLLQGVDPFKHPSSQTLDLARAPLHVPSSPCFPLVQHVEEPVAGDSWKQTCLTTFHIAHVPR